MCERNFLFERTWKNDCLLLSTFKDNLFELNHAETLSSSIFILAKNALMFLWQINKFISSTNITSIESFDALNSHLHKLGKDAARVQILAPQIISRQFWDIS